MTATTTLAATAAARDAIDAARAAHFAASFAAQAADDALAAADADPEHAAAHRDSAASWAADADAHRESSAASMAEAAVWDAAAAHRGLSGRDAIAAALVASMRRGRLDGDRAVEVIANPAAYMAGEEVLIEEEGVSYSLWGNPVYW